MLLKWSYTIDFKYDVLDCITIIIIVIYKGVAESDAVLVDDCFNHPEQVDIVYGGMYYL